MNKLPEIGQYVLATKYSDGCAADAWAVGFYAGTTKDRHMVVDAEGNSLRPNGFRRVQEIPPEVGAWLLANAGTLEVCASDLWAIVEAGIPAQEDRAVNETPLIYALMTVLGILAGLYLIGLAIYTLWTA